MCFSASASFIASGILVVIGLFSVISAKERKWLFVALIPLFFAIQQCAEGLVWVYKSPIAALAFLFFAFIVWPFYIPFSCLMVESDNARSRLLYALTIIGSGVSVCLLFGVLSSDLSFYIQDCHIVYDAAGRLFTYGYMWVALAGGYCMTTILPFFISSHRYMKIMGILIGCSCLIAYLFYTVYFVSVWCFFAALISSAVLVIVRKNR
jgi:hypothetical protein